MKPERFDPQAASEAHLRARYAFDCKMDPFDAWVKGITNVSPFQENHRCLVWDNDHSQRTGRVRSLTSRS